MPLVVRLWHRQPGAIPSRVAASQTRCSKSLRQLGAQRRSLHVAFTTGSLTYALADLAIGKDEYGWCLR